MKIRMELEGLVVTFETRPTQEELQVEEEFIQSLQAEAQVESRGPEVNDEVDYDYVEPETSGLNDQPFTL